LNETLHNIIASNRTGKHREGPGRTGRCRIRSDTRPGGQLAGPPECLREVCGIERMIRTYKYDPCGGKVQGRDAKMQYCARCMSANRARSVAARAQPRQAQHIARHHSTSKHRAALDNNLNGKLHQIIAQGMAGEGRGGQGRAGKRRSRRDTRPGGRPEGPDERLQGFAVTHSNV
jgi:hypothetical protein